MAQPVIICLGRYGDIMNALPIAYELSKTGEKPKFCTSQQFWEVLDGCSYVQPVVWGLEYMQLPTAIKYTAGHNPIVCQSYRHPDSTHQTDSYQKESYRHAGWLDRFHKLPLVFDNRSPEREAALAAKLPENAILWAGTSVSSPFPMAGAIWNKLKAEYGDRLYDISNFRAHRVYDMLGMMDKAALLVCTDTMHLHLSRASNIPVVAMINNGWFGSVPHDRAVGIRYGEVTPDKVLSLCKSQLK
jgi:hypothetical protein